MFLKKSSTTLQGKTYNHYKIVESYRENGKVKHRILFPLGALTDEQAARMQLAIRAYSDPEILVSKLDDLVVTKHLAYLDIVSLHHLWQTWALDEFFKTDRWIKAMVLNRCLNPVAKINIRDWLSKTVLPALLDFDPNSFSSYDVYRELDRLTERESDLQSFLYRQLQSRRPDVSNVFFYDITSCYLEGSRCVLSALGYSRDHRADREQIVIALMITPKGYPFYWRVMEGNTQDITTVQGLIEDVKNRFAIKNCTMVFDRGMVSSENLQSLEGEKWSYVSAMDRDEIAISDFFLVALPDPPTLQDWEQVMAMREFIPFDEDYLLYFREFVDGAHRYILTFDVGRFQDEQRMHQKRMDQVLAWIDQKNKSLVQAKKARQREILEREIQSMLKRKRVKKFLTITIEPNTHTVSNKKGIAREVQSFKLSYAIDEQALTKELRLHGITCFISNLAQTEIPPREIITWYRRKNKVEEAFHEIKSHLELRPVHLTQAKRVKAHVTICTLAYFLYNDMERRLKENYSKLSPEDALEVLGRCQLNSIGVKGTNQRVLKITEFDNEQRQLIQTLECEYAGEAKWYKKVLKKAENLV
ncbi:MAG: IS1634 family transposase [Bacillota bacterium]